MIGACCLPASSTYCSGRSACRALPIATFVPVCFVITSPCLTAAIALQVRGSTAPAEELLYILHHSGAVGLIVQETATLAPLLPALRCQVRPLAPAGMQLLGQ